MGNRVCCCISPAGRKSVPGASTTPLPMGLTTWSDQLHVLMLRPGKPTPLERAHGNRPRVIISAECGREGQAGPIQAPAGPQGH